MRKTLIILAALVCTCAHAGVDANGHQKYEDGLYGARGPMSHADQMCRLFEEGAAADFQAKIRGTKRYHLTAGLSPGYVAFSEWVWAETDKATDEAALRVLVRDKCLSSVEGSPYDRGIGNRLTMDGPRRH